MNFNDRISKLKVKNLRTEDLYAYNNCLKGHSRSAGGRKWQYEGGVS